MGYEFESYWVLLYFLWNNCRITFWGTVTTSNWNDDKGNSRQKLIMNECVVLKCNILRYSFKFLSQNKKKILLSLHVIWT